MVLLPSVIHLAVVGVEQLTDGIGMEMDGVRGKIGSLLDLKDFFLRPKLFS